MDSMATLGGGRRKAPGLSFLIRWRLGQRGLHRTVIYQMLSTVLSMKFCCKTNTIIELAENYINWIGTICRTENKECTATERCLQWTEECQGDPLFDQFCSERELVQHVTDTKMLHLSDPNEVVSVMQGLNNTKSTGPDGTSVFLLNFSTTELPIPLAHLENICCHKGVFPVKLNSKIIKQHGERTIFTIRGQYLLHLPEKIYDLGSCHLSANRINSIWF